MPAKDGFDPTHPLPQFLADRAEQDIGNATDGAVPASRAFKASILIATATATGIAVLAMGNPAGLLAEMSASLVGNSTPQPTPAIQSAADTPALVASAADAQDLPPTTNEVATRTEIAASEPAGKDQTEKSEPPSEALFRQFQAWAAEQDAQPSYRPLVQDVPAPVVKRVAGNAPAANRLNRRRETPARPNRNNPIIQWSIRGARRTVPLQKS